MKKTPKKSQLFLPYFVFVSVSLFLCFSLSLSLFPHTHTNTNTHRHTHKKKYIKYKTHMHDTPSSQPISMHARMHTQHKRPKRSNRNWKQNPCAPQTLPNLSLQVSSPSSSSITSTGQSIFSCCWQSQVRPCAAAINAPCPTGDYRRHRVSQKPSIAKKTTPSTTENTPPPPQSLQNPTRKKRNWRKNQWGASTWCLQRQSLLATNAPIPLYPHMGNAHNLRYSRAPLRGARRGSTGVSFSTWACASRRQAPSSFAFTMPEEEGTCDSVSAHLLVTAANIFGWAGDPTEQRADFAVANASGTSRCCNYFLVGFSWCHLQFVLSICKWWQCCSRFMVSVLVWVMSSWIL